VESGLRVDTPMVSQTRLPRKWRGHHLAHHPIFEALGSASPISLVVFTLRWWLRTRFVSHREAHSVDRKRQPESRTFPGCDMDDLERIHVLDHQGGGIATEADQLNQRGRALPLFERLDKQAEMVKLCPEGMRCAPTSDDAAPESERPRNVITRPCAPDLAPVAAVMARLEPVGDMDHPVVVKAANDIHHVLSVDAEALRELVNAQGIERQGGQDGGVSSNAPMEQRIHAESPGAGSAGNFLNGIVLITFPK